MVGFSSWTLEAGDRSAVRLLRGVSEAIEPPFLERRGEIDPVAVSARRRRFKAKGAPADLSAHAVVRSS